MTRSISVFASLLASVLVLCLPAGALHAQNRTIDIELALPLGTNGTDYFLTQNQELVTDYFNLARCQCSESLPFPGTDYGFFEVELTAQDITLTDEVNLVVGTQCADQDPMLRNCETIEEQINVGDLTRVRRQIPVDLFMFPNEACQELDRASNVWMLYDDGADNIIDDSFTLKDFPEFSADARPPPGVLNPEATGAEQAIQVTWEGPNNIDEVEYFYILCANADGTPVEGQSPFSDVYDTTKSLCGLPLGGTTEPPPEVDAGLVDAMTVDAMTVDAMTVDAMVPDAGDRPDAGPVNTVLQLSDMDEAFICGRVESSSESFRITGLENGLEYEVAVVSVDEARNPTYTYVGTAIPQSVDDFWEHYGNEGGQAEGGVCLVTSTFGDGGPTQALRDFRDNTLASFWLGRVLIENYYEYIAPLGVYAERYTVVRVAAAIVIAPLALIAGFWEYTGLALKLLTLALFLCWRRRRQLRGMFHEYVDRPIGAGLRGAWRERFASALGHRLPDIRIAPTSVAAAAALAVLLYGANSVAAQGNRGAFDPYWEEFEPVAESAPLEASQWNFGIKLGPYLPDVDSEFSGAEMGPYAQTFGGSSIMTQFELDRYFAWPAGQLGVTASLGWASATASAYALCPGGAAPGECIGDLADLDMDGVADRADGDETGFRLLPLSLGAVYRLTILDDRVKIPLIPYAKAALSYYLWWVTAPDGSVAERPNAECADPDDPALDCEGERGLGASLGIQFSLGLAVRAERIDKQAATSLKNEFGIEHAGFYAELAYAKVDGFGSDTKLAVGDFTWFAGLNFEF